MGPHQINTFTHVGFGLAALAVGLLPMLTLKGSRWHRRAGRWFAWLGLVVIATAFIGIVFYDAPSPLVAAAIAAGYQFIGGLRALSLGTHGPTWLDALLALGGLSACAALLVFMGPGTPEWTPAIGYSTAGYVVTLALYDLSRHFWSGLWRRRVRPLDHGLKLTGAFFAMLSAGAGNVFRDFQPWSQVGPSLLGVVVMVLLAFAYALREGRKPTPA